MRASQSPEIEPTRSATEENDHRGISMRYIADDVDTAVEFYAKHPSFSVAVRPARGFAILTGDGFRPLVSGMQDQAERLRRCLTGEGQSLADGTAIKSKSEIWRRRSLCDAGARFRNEIVQGMDGKQILLEDPAGNPIELFEAPKRAKEIALRSWLKGSALLGWRQQRFWRGRPRLIRVLLVQKAAAVTVAAVRSSDASGPRRFTASDRSAMAIGRPTMSRKRRRGASRGALRSDQPFLSGAGGDPRGR